jgi:hypothetical protein
MLSLILGAGALLTGYFGINFSDTFAAVFFAPLGRTDLFHRLSIGVVSVSAFCSIILGLYVIAANWSDYRDSFRIRRKT